jgi:hypothetical protein
MRDPFPGPGTGRAPRWLRLIGFAAAIAISAVARGQQEVPLAPELLHRIPAAYRGRAKGVRLSPEAQEYYRSAADADFFSAVAEQIGRTDEGRAFLISAADREVSPAIRRAIFETFGNAPGTAKYVESHPAAVSALSRHAASDPDAPAALAALEALRHIRTEQLGDLLRRRLKLARGKTDQAGLELLSEEESRHYKWFGEVATSKESRDAPPVFSVVPPDKPIRAVAFGDFGSGQETQTRTAAAIRAYAASRPFDFGITLGDNFYPVGMDSPLDSRWKTQWEELYGPLGIAFYASLGNHDYGQPASVVAEMWYSGNSPSWRAPARYYSFTAGPAQFFQIDTVDLSERELRWLDEELERSRAVWKIAYGHYQIYSATRGDNDEKQDDLVHRLLPILKKRRADLYICGHDHNLQILEEDGGVHFVVAGAGGASLYDFEQKDYARSSFRAKTNGFAVLEADAGALNVRLVDTDGKELRALQLTKGGARQAAPGK